MTGQLIPLVNHVWMLVEDAREFAEIALARGTQ